MIIPLVLPYPPKREYPFELGVDVIHNNGEEMFLGSIVDIKKTLDSTYNQQFVALEIKMVKSRSGKSINLDAILEIMINGLKEVAKDES